MQPYRLRVAGTAGSGAWSGQNKKLAILISGSDWHFITPTSGWVVRDLTTANRYAYSGSAWAVLAEPWEKQKAAPQASLRHIMAGLAASPGWTVPHLGHLPGLSS